MSDDLTEEGKTVYDRTKIKNEGNNLTITVAEAGEPSLKYTPTDSEMEVYGVAYEVSYYLTLDAKALRDSAQANSDDINKAWDWRNGRDSVTYAPKQAEFALYAGDQKYNLTVGEGGNANGNLVVRCNGDAEVTLDTLPKYGEDGATPIAWTVKEVGAVYTATEGENTVEHDASGVYLEEHFTVAETTEAATGDKPQSFAFTNALNALTTVQVTKAWTDNDTTSHDGDVVYFDLYRTTEPINNETDYKAEAKKGTSQKVIGDIALNKANGWTYTNDLLEKMDNSNNLWNYFVVEGSVAGYDTTYSRETSANRQNVKITNAPNYKTGSLTLKKVITAAEGSDRTPNPTGKQFKFTLWNSGRYLSSKTGETWAKTEADRVFSVPADAVGVTKDDVPAGEYTTPTARWTRAS